MNCSARRAVWAMKIGRDWGVEVDVVVEKLRLNIVFFFGVGDEVCW